MIKETKNAIMNKHNAVLENISLSETAESACGRRTAYTCNSSAAKLVSAKLPHTASLFFLLHSNHRIATTTTCYLRYPLERGSVAYTVGWGAVLKKYEGGDGHFAFVIIMYLSLLCVYDTIMKNNTKNGCVQRSQTAQFLVPCKELFLCVRTRPKRPPHPRAQAYAIYATSHPSSCVRIM